MKKQPLEDDFMDDKAVENAMTSLFGAIDKARQQRKLPKAKAFTVIVEAPDGTEVTGYGCDCVPCRVNQVTGLARAFGMGVTDISLSTVADAARAVH